MVFEEANFPTTTPSRRSCHVFVSPLSATVTVRDRRFTEEETSVGAAGGVTVKDIVEGVPARPVEVTARIE